MKSNYWTVESIKQIKKKNNNCTVYFRNETDKNSSNVNKIQYHVKFKRKKKATTISHTKTRLS